MGLFRLVARVGRWRRRATFVLEEWSPIPFVRGWTEPGLQVPWRLFTARGGEWRAAPRFQAGDKPMTLSDGQATRSDDWGFPRWRPYGAKGRAAARCGCATGRVATSPATGRRPSRPTAPSAGCSARPRRRVQQELELFRRPDRRGSRQARRGGERAPRLIARAAHYGSGAVRATAAAAATRCARSTRSSWTATPTTRRSGRLPPARQGASPRPQAGRQAKPPSASASPGRLRRASKKAENRREALAIEHEGAGAVGDGPFRRRHARCRGRRRSAGSACSIRSGR